MLSFRADESTTKSKFLPHVFFIFMYLVLSELILCEKLIAALKVLAINCFSLLQIEFCATSQDCSPLTAFLKITADFCSEAACHLTGKGRQEVTLLKASAA